MSNQFVNHLLDCLGGSWPAAPALDSRTEDIIQRDGYIMEKVSYRVEPEERVSAWLLIPESTDTTNKASGIAVWHQHANDYALGKSEPAGLIGDPAHHTGVALVKEGYVVLCPDALCFEDRQNSMLQGQDFERFVFLKYLVEGQCLAWKNILDMRRAIDYLCQRPDVDASAIGCYGHSLGSTFTWLLGPWEPRLKCLVGNCCLPTYDAIHRTHLLHSYSNFIPGLKQYGDIEDIAALIAPRPLHLNFGALDRLNPLPEVEKAVVTIRNAYEKKQAKDHFTCFIQQNTGHDLSPAMWKKVRETFAKHL